MSGCVYRKLLIQLTSESWYTLSVTSLRIWSVTGPFFSMMAMIASWSPAIFPRSKSPEVSGVLAGAAVSPGAVSAAGAAAEALSGTVSVSVSLAAAVLSCDAGSGVFSTAGAAVFFTASSTWSSTGVTSES